MLGRLKELGGGSSNASAATPLLQLVGGSGSGSGGWGRPPVLPVRTKPKAGASPLSPVSSSSLGILGSMTAGLQPRWRHAVLCMAALLLITAAAGGAVAGAVSWYMHSIVHESPTAVAAAAAQAQAAAAAVAVAAVAGDTSAFDTSAAASAALITAKYTVVVMSYVKRLKTIPLVVNKLGSCPSIHEVLLVWNGDDPPSPSYFNSRAPVRIRPEKRNDLSNRMFPDGGIRTAAVLLVDDDLLLRCADVERAFAKWQHNQQAVVGLFPRLTSPGPPPQYLGEKVVFRERRYNVMLTAAEFVHLNLLKLYHSDRYAAGRVFVYQLTNCEDILLNFVAATAILEGRPVGTLPGYKGHSGYNSSSGDGGGGSGSGSGNSASGPAADDSSSEAAQQGRQERRLPQAVWAQPSRRLDISSLSGVGISKGRAVHEAKRRRCVAQFTEWYGQVLQTERVEWDLGGAPWRLLTRPMCRLPFMGCVYL